MLMSYTHYEFVDDVMKLTLAEGPGEAGTVLHFTRATWDDDGETHVLCNESVSASSPPCAAGG
ncbi:hypothetical protein [Dactylosporangium darangshiense]|uniref:Uncharacterized protein n=1 Tax=Dactylosporangium darangshiense TaxID=579108 RepID=A0ABP8D845_9ACTN